MEIDPSKYYVFYDGDCSLCNSRVQWILKNDRKDQFLFASLQSAFGQRFLKDRGLNHKEFNTFYLWMPHSFYLIKSQAVLKIAKILGGKHAVLAALGITPTFFNDLIYDYAARNRKKLSAQKCPMPSESDKRKFVS